MNNIILAFITMLISGIEPFLGHFSADVAWAAVLGVKKQSVSGAALVFLLGLTRDVLLVNRLGQSPIILMIVWAAAAAISSRFSSRNLFPVAVPVLAGYSAITFLETGKFNGWGILITEAVSLLVIWIWTLKDSRESGIKVRLSS